MSDRISSVNWEVGGISRALTSSVWYTCIIWGQINGDIRFCMVKMFWFRRFTQVGNAKDWVIRSDVDASEIVSEGVGLLFGNVGIGAKMIGVFGHPDTPPPGHWAKKSRIVATTVIVLVRRVLIFHALSIYWYARVYVHGVAVSTLPEIARIFHVPSTSSIQFAHGSWNRLPWGREICDAPERLSDGGVVSLQFAVIIIFPAGIREGIAGCHHENVYPVRVGTEGGETTVS